MKRPISFKIDKEVHDASLSLLESNRVKYRSFTNIVEQALLEYIEKEKSIGRGYKSESRYHKDK